MPEQEASSVGLDQAQLGKRVGEHLYLHVSTLMTLPEAWQSLVAQAAQLASLNVETNYNVIKLHEDLEQLSLLDYPSFFEDPFPSLAHSWRISISRKTVIYRTYEESRNPPILHRKELLLPIDDPRRLEFALVTESAEAMGLFADPKSIGFREYWYRLISDRGYELLGSEFVPVANSPAHAVDEALDANANANVQRHLTALSRSNFSAPVQALSRHGLLHQGITFFDYGCGRGDDVRGLVANKIDATGWDPHFAPDAEKRIADAVNIGFVINVIEDMGERIEALRGAYVHTRGVLAVAAMLSSQTAPEGRPLNDGYVTSRNTFQKYFTQAQLRDFIELALEENAIASSPGVFFVFRDKDLEQQFLSRRYGHRSPTILSRGWIHSRPRREKIPRLSHSTRLFEEHRDLLSGLWLRMLELGRRPDEDEIPNLTDVEASVGSLSRALRLVESHFDARELEIARNSRSTDILVLLAMLQFEKRKPYRHLENRLQRDIRIFFGDYSSAQALARQDLYSLGNATAIDKACREAAEKGLGWLEESQSFQLHVSLVERLPGVLRIFIGCATVLFGDISTFDLVKIHIRSGKVSLMKYEDFQFSPLPRLVQRVKVKLRDLDIDLFEYGNEFPPTLLYNKSRYVNEEFVHYAEQVAFEDDLERLNLFDPSSYGPSEAAFREKLERIRFAIDGFRLVRSKRIPDLDEPCGETFTYRDFIECGETQEALKIPNLPKSPETYTAIYDLATQILDPVIEYFGAIRLTYGFSSPALATKIQSRIAPKLDQHACHEMTPRRQLICARGGAACDFIVDDEDMEEVSNWIIANLPYDRLYFYGRNRPVHISYGEQHARAAYRLEPAKSGRLVPRLF